ncbi:universal stress protein [Halostella litorea]|uniref:universal stress protein n=1 Tax=Halostella litorea TaxID=2528831 RepID=UPI00109295B2|nr:universal stress protein [Halostella litorea]
MYDTILLPTDGSDHAVRAAEHGLALARWFDATVHVVNVIDLARAGGLFNAGGVGEEFVSELEAEAKERIGTVEAVTEGVDAVETAVVRGAPAEAILDYADEHGVDLVAMGTHGRTGVERYVAGSVTERVVRLSDVPVLTAQALDGGGFEGYDDVLVPTDGSPHAERAAEHGIAIAQAADARVHALNVVDFGKVAATSNLEAPAELLDRLRDEGEEEAEAVAQRARDAGVDAVTAVVEGTPSRDVLEYAEDRGVDLIAMGTAGRTGLNRILLGSTAERTVRRAAVPVLTVSDRSAD